MILIKGDKLIFSNGKFTTPIKLAEPGRAIMVHDNGDLDLRDVMAEYNGGYSIQRVVRHFADPGDGVSVDSFFQAYKDGEPLNNIRFELIDDCAWYYSDIF